jgi:hypothetical protein
MISWAEEVWAIVVIGSFRAFRGTEFRNYHRRTLPRLPKMDTLYSVPASDQLLNNCNVQPQGTSIWPAGTPVKRADPQMAT